MKTQAQITIDTQAAQLHEGGVMYEALYTETTEDEQLDCLQQLVNTGDAWRLEGSVGRACMDALEARLIALGEVGHRDYWGSYVPSRHEVAEGTKGHAQYAREV